MIFFKFLFLLPLPFLLAASDRPDRKITLITIGDSTMADNDRYLDDPGDPGRGWAQELQHYFDPSRLVVKNMAASGRSTKSYIDEGKWDNVLRMLEPGDFLLIQFGHNDAKEDGKRHTDPETAFKDNLRLFVSQAREKGVTPVIATSVVRRWFTPEGKLRDSHGRYVPAAAEVAAEACVALVDMNRLTGELVEGLGPQKSKELYLWVEPGVCGRFPEGSRDDTHLSLAGAAAFSRLFAGECVRSNNTLAPYVIPLE